MDLKEVDSRVEVRLVIYEYWFFFFFERVWVWIDEVFISGIVLFKVVGVILGL